MVNVDKAAANDGDDEKEWYEVAEAGDPFQEWRDWLAGEVAKQDAAPNAGAKTAANAMAAFAANVEINSLAARNSEKRALAAARNADQQATPLLAKADADIALHVQHEANVAINHALVEEGRRLMPPPPPPQGKRSCTASPPPPPPAVLGPTIEV